MIITSLKLKDFGRHANVTADTNAPVVGLLGPNGSGKSTILKAIEFAFTGVLPDTLDTYVRGTGAEDGPNNAVVEVSFVKNGMSGHIMRQIGKTPKRSLTWDGQTIKTAKEVDAVLSEIFNADKQAITNAIFISQGELDRLLFGTPAAREQLFTKLLLLSFLEKRADLVDGRIKTINSGLQDFSALQDELVLQRQAAESAVSSIEGQLAQTKDWSPEIEVWRAYSKTITAIEGGVNLVDSTKKNIRDTEATLRSKLSYHKEHVPSWEPDYDDPFKLITDYERISGKLETGRKELAALEALKSSRIRYNEAVRVKGEIEKELEGYDAEIASVISKLNGASSDSKRRLVQQQERRDKLVVELDAEQKNMLRIHDEMSPLVAAPLPYPEDQAAVDATELEDAERDTIKCETRLEVLKAAVEHVHEEMTNCPVCQHRIDGSLITPEAVEEVRKNYDIKVEQLKKFRAHVEAKLALNTTHAASIEKKRVELGNCLNAIAAKTAELGAIPNFDLNALQQELQETIELENTQQAAARAIPGVKVRLTSNQKILDEFTPEKVKSFATFDAVRLETLQKDVDELELKKANLKNAYTEIESLVVELGNQKTNLANFEDIVTRLTVEADVTRAKFPDELSSIVEAAPEDVQQGTAQDKFQRITEALDGKQAAWNSLSGQLKQAEQSLTGVKTRQTELEGRVAEDALRRSLVESLRQLRDTLGKSGIPMAYIRYKFSQLAELTQEHLVKINANFAISEDPDQPVSLLFTRLDEDTGTMGQDKLSGGQRVRLSVAFLMAVQQLVIPEIGFLVLDEPSVHLDDDGVENLKDLLITLSVELGNAEAQVIVCDHNTALRPAFARVVELK